MQTIAGKTAIITGAGRGIGRATAIAFAKEGIHVGLIGKTPANLEKVAEELNEYGVNVTFAAADVADNESVIAAVEHVKSELGPIDILINNAGIGKFGKFLELISRGIQANYRCQPDGHVLRHTRSTARND